MIPDNILPDLIPIRRAEKNSSYWVKVHILAVSTCAEGTPKSSSCSRLAAHRSIWYLWVAGFPFGDVIHLETVLTECFIDFVAYLEGGKGDAGADAGYHFFALCAIAGTHLVECVAEDCNSQCRAIRHEQRLSRHSSGRRAGWECSLP